MSDFLDIRTWSILQWVLVVLAAGFIGQFGKSFAQFIIAKVKSRRSASKTAATIPDGPSSIALGQSAPSVLDKKALKAILKQQKKAVKKK